MTEDTNKEALEALDNAERIHRNWTGRTHPAKWAKAMDEIYKHLGTYRKALESVEEQNDLEEERAKLWREKRDISHSLIILQAEHDQLLCERDRYREALVKIGYYAGCRESEAIADKALESEAERQERSDTLEQQPQSVDEKAISDAVHEFVDRRALTADTQTKEFMCHFGIYLASQGYLQSGWRDIESAPKDGTAILGYYAGNNWIRNGERVGKHNCVTIYWNTNTQLDVGNPHPWDSFGPSSYMEKDITHWMPLPKPPTQEKG